MKTKMTPPPFLTPAALAVWESVLPEIQSQSIATEIESHALGAYCQSVADLAAAQAEIDMHGMITKTERGMIKNPACTLKNMALGNILAFAREFGLTPKSRSRTTMSRRQNANSNRA